MRNGIINHKNISDKIEFTKFELDNGLRIVLSEDHSIPTVALNICYHVGSKDEETGKTGFAHLFEHLMFEGSVNVPKGEYERLTTFAGGENNAYTTEDKTNYYLLLPSNQLELGLWLESDRMLECVVNKKSLETQKKVVIEEKKQNFDNRPYGTVSIEFAPRLFPGSRYGWDTIGSTEDIKNTSLKDVKDFYARFYTPNNAVLSLTGNFKTKETADLITRYFSGIGKGNSSGKEQLSYTSPNKEIKEKIYDDIQFPGIFTAYRIPQENTKEFFAFELLSEILSGGDSSRLYQELIYEKQLASEVGCWADCKESAGALHIYAILLPGADADKTEKEIYNIIDDVLNKGISENELQKAKNRIETKNFFRRQYILTRADILAHYETFYGDPDLINVNINNYNSVTGDELKEYSRKFLQPENRVTLVYLPK